jgi:hypothetical protein
MGIAAIGIGSLIYHMTLQWRFQQWDELPMDYSATLCESCGCLHWTWREEGMALAFLV